MGSRPARCAHVQRLPLAAEVVDQSGKNDARCAAILCYMLSHCWTCLSEETYGSNIQHIGPPQPDEPRG